MHGPYEESRYAWKLGKKRLSLDDSVHCAGESQGACLAAAISGKKMKMEGHHIFELLFLR